MTTVAGMQVQQLGLGEYLVDYHDAWQEQRAWHAKVAAGSHPPVLLMVEHTSVYTAGRRTSRSDRASAAVELVEVDRGGRITWHGPGQLVVYPILRLREPVDVVAYVRHLEEAIIATARHFGVVGQRVEGRSGVWVRHAHRPDRKLAAIGVRVAQGVTMHGLALNVSPDLTHFTQIVPCGITDAETTSIQRETGSAPPLTTVAAILVDHLRHHLQPVLPPTLIDPTANPQLLETQS